MNPINLAKDTAEVTEWLPQKSSDNKEIYVSKKDWPLQMATQLLKALEGCNDNVYLVKKDSGNYGFAIDQDKYLQYEDAAKKIKHAYIADRTKSEKPTRNISYPPDIDSVSEEQEDAQTITPALAPIEDIHDMQAFRDPETVFQKLASVLENDEEYRTPPEGNPFHGTDLVIIDVKNEHEKLNLPLNFISKNEFNEITEFYSNLCAGKDSKFLVAGSTEEFKKEILEAIKKLLTRKVGRQLFKRLKADPSVTEILIDESSTKGSKAFHTKSGKASTLRKLQIDIHEDRELITKTSKKGNERLSNPVFTALAHELIHILHKKSHEDGNEEHRTITGWSPDGTFDEVNENSIRAAFGLGYRTTHKGVEKKPSSLKLDDSEEIPKELGQYLFSIVTGELESELAEFFKANDNIDLSTKKLKGYPLLDELFLYAIHYNCLHSLEKLLGLVNDPHFNTKDTKRQGWINMLPIAMDKANLQVINLLLKQKDINIFAETEKYETVLHVLVRNHLIKNLDKVELVRQLIKRGADPHAKVRDATFLDYCSRELLALLSPVLKETES